MFFNTHICSLKENLSLYPMTSLRYIPEGTEREDSNRLMCANVHRSVTHTRQKVETTQVSIN